MKIISPDYFFKYLISGEDVDSEISLEWMNQYLDENNISRHRFSIRISDDDADFIYNMMNTHDTYDDINEEAFGTLQYLGTNIDDASKFPVYSEVFKLEIYQYEKYRDSFVEMMEAYATGLNRHMNELTIDGKRHTLYFILGQNSTPYYSAKEDINGAEMFKTSLTIICNVYENIILSNNMSIQYIRDDGGIEDIPYITVNLKRDIELYQDNKASYDKTFTPNKSDLSITIGCFYTDSEFSKKMMECVGDETKLETTVFLNFIESVNNIEFGYELIPVSVSPTITFGSPISFTASFKRST